MNARLFLPFRQRASTDLAGRPKAATTAGHTLVVILAFVFPGLSIAQGIVPLGDEFLVNSHTPSTINEYPSVAASPGGDFIVVWDAIGSPGADTDLSIQAQRYSPLGDSLGSQLQVNEYAPYPQTLPAVAMRADGAFVVVWKSNGSFGDDDSYDSIQARRYDANGSPLSGQFQVNSYTTSFQQFPQVDIDADGDFVVVWQGYGSAGNDDSAGSIHARQFSWDETPRGAELQVNTYTTGVQCCAAVAVHAAGDFVVVWSSNGSNGADSSGFGVLGQRFDSAGTPQGGETQVNSHTTGGQLVPAVAMSSGGDFVVVWRSYGFGTDYSLAIVGRRFAAGGTPLASDFLVNTYTVSDQRGADVALDGAGNFVVSWWSYGSSGDDTSYASIQARVYDPSGVALGPDFQVNSYTTGVQRYPNVALDDGGHFTVAWFSSDAADNTGRTIRAQRYALTSFVFYDGFESGDTSAWSSTVP